MIQVNFARKINGILNYFLEKNICLCISVYMKNANIGEVSAEMAYIYTW